MLFTAVCLAICNRGLFDRRSGKPVLKHAFLKYSVNPCIKSHINSIIVSYESVVIGIYSDAQHYVLFVCKLTWCRLNLKTDHKIWLYATQMNKLHNFFLCSFNVIVTKWLTRCGRTWQIFYPRTTPGLTQGQRRLIHQQAHPRGSQFWQSWLELIQCLWFISALIQVIPSIVKSSIV